MTARIVSGTTAQKADSIDRGQEAEPDLSLWLADSQTNSAVPEKEEFLLVLTGAIGFVGMGRLNRLWIMSSITRTNCTPVRDPSTLSSFSSDPRKDVFSGNLSALYLGLSDIDVKEYSTSFKGWNTSCCVDSLRWCRNRWWDHIPKILKAWSDLRMGDVRTSGRSLERWYPLGLNSGRQLTHRLRTTQHGMFDAYLQSANALLFDFHRIY